jgi:hypothetical protein
MSPEDREWLLNHLHDQVDGLLALVQAARDEPDEPGLLVAVRKRGLHDPRDA